MNKLIPIERIENKIYLIRGQKVMLDFDLAALYGVKTFVLNQAVKRNRARFPKDFMFQLSKEEVQNLKFLFDKQNLKSQFVISSWGGRRTKPYAFTEQGVAMLSSILHSKRAIMVNIQIMRAFVKLKQVLATHQEVSRKIKELEHKTNKHETQIHSIFEAIRKLIDPPEKPKRKIGFLADKN